MKAMILAAGLGTRLQHLTQDKPKALVEIKGMTLLERSIHKLTQAGVNEIIINIHHFAPLMRDFINQHRFKARISFSDETSLLLDTGGGIKQAAWFFDDNKPFIVYNVDILTDLDLKAMYDFHNKNQNLATLAVRNRNTQRYLLFDSNMRLCGRYNAKTEEKTLVVDTNTPCEAFAFSGIHVISPEIFSLMPAQKVFSITDLYMKIACNQNITGYLHNQGFWMDMGKLQSLEDINPVLI